jgi:hypothetical protein
LASSAHASHGDTCIFTVIDKATYFFWLHSYFPKIMAEAAAGVGLHGCAESLDRIAHLHLLVRSRHTRSCRNWIKRCFEQPARTDMVRAASEREVEEEEKEEIS